MQPSMGVRPRMIIRVAVETGCAIAGTGLQWGGTDTRPRLGRTQTRRLTVATYQHSVPSGRRHRLISDDYSGAPVAPGRSRRSRRSRLSRNLPADRICAPAPRARRASVASEVMTTMSCGCSSASNRRMISSSAESAAAAGALVTVSTEEQMGSGRSNTTVTSARSRSAKISSRWTSAANAACRSRHQPSGRAPMTFIASTR